MAGINHHYIPRMLLRGFLSRPKNREEFVWVHGLSGQPVEENLNVVGANRHYYGQDGRGINHDEAITSYENWLERKLQKYKSASDGFVIDSITAAKFMTHFAVRNDHLRTSVRELLVQIIDSYLKHASDPSWLASALGFTSKDPPRVFREFLKRTATERLGEGQVTPDRLARAQSVLYPLFKLQAPIIAQKAAEILTADLKEMQSEFPSIISDAHSQISAENPESWQRVSGLRRKQWMIRDSAEDLVLPDCVAIAKFSTKSAPIPFWMSGRSDELEWAIMPITYKRYLVCGEPQKIEIAGLNESFARCSVKFFVSNTNDQVKQLLRPLIGTATAEEISLVAHKVLSTGPQEIAERIERRTELR